MVAQKQNGNGRLAALSDDGLPDLVVVRGNVTLFKVTPNWPKAGLNQFPTSRPAPIPGKPKLRAECGFWVADDEIKREAGLPVEAPPYIECNIITIGFCSFREARLHRGTQVCATHDESVAAEGLAKEMVG